MAAFVIVGANASQLRAIITLALPAALPIVPAKFAVPMAVAVFVERWAGVALQDLPAILPASALPAALPIVPAKFAVPMAAAVFVERWAGVALRDLPVILPASAYHHCRVAFRETPKNAMEAIYTGTIRAATRGKWRKLAVIIPRPIITNAMAFGYNRRWSRMIASMAPVRRNKRGIISRIVPNPEKYA